MTARKIFFGELKNLISKNDGVLENIVLVFEYLEKNIVVWKNCPTLNDVVLKKIKDIRSKKYSIELTAAVKTALAGMEYKLGYSCSALTKKGLRCKNAVKVSAETTCFCACHAKKAGVIESDGLELIAKAYAEPVKPADPVKPAEPVKSKKGVWPWRDRIKAAKATNELKELKE